MNEGSFGKQEKLDVKVELATEKDWQEYKELRLMAITGRDSVMFGGPDVERDKIKNDEEWRKDLSPRDDMFFMISRVESDAVGIGRASKLKGEEEVWSIGQGYVREDFQGKGVGKKLFSARLEEIKKRGGIKAVTYMAQDNLRSRRIAEFFGFKKINTIMRMIETKRFLPLKWRCMELYLNDPEVIKKIDEILNAR